MDISNIDTIQIYINNILILTFGMTVLYVYNILDSKISNLHFLIERISDKSNTKTLSVSEIDNHARKIVLNKEIEEIVAKRMHKELQNMLNVQLEGLNDIELLSINRKNHKLKQIEINKDIEGKNKALGWSLGFYN